MLETSYKEIKSDLNQPLAPNNEDVTFINLKKTNWRYMVLFLQCLILMAK